MSKQLSIASHASALALVLLALTGAAGELREARLSSADAASAPFVVSEVLR